MLKLLLYNAVNLGRRYNMKEIWEKFVNNKVAAGHEESPEECTQVPLEWLKTIS